MLRLLYPLCSCLLLGTVGCSTDAGVLVGVSGDAPAELEFIVGLERGGRFMIDDETSGLRVALDGRNLRSRPYQLLLQPPAGRDGSERLLVLVRGLRIERDGSRRVVSMAVLEPPQPFVADELLRRNLSLRGVGGQVGTAFQNGCYTARIGDQQWRWVIPGNLDCDPVRADAEPPDCDDEDPLLYPGSAERCDGRDNSCDEKLAPEQGICFALENGEDGPCREGTRLCERAGEGAGACTPTAKPAPAAYCARFADCKDQADPRPCLLAATRQTRRCVHRLDTEGKPCGAAKVALKQPRRAESCRWTIFEARALSATFGGNASTDVCEPTLDLSASEPPLNGSVTLDYFADGKAGWLVEVVMTSETVESCDKVEAVSCE